MSLSQNFLMFFLQRALEGFFLSITAYWTFWSQGRTTTARSSGCLRTWFSWVPTTNLTSAGSWRWSSLNISQRGLSICCKQKNCCFILFFFSVILFSLMLWKSALLIEHATFGETFQAWRGITSDCQYTYVYKCDFYVWTLLFVSLLDLFQHLLVTKSFCRTVWKKGAKHW